MNFASVDITDLANDGVAMHVNGPDGVPLFKADGDTPVTITLLGQDSDRLSRIMNQRGNRHLRQRGPVVMTVEQGLTADIEYLAKATIAWDGVGLDEEETTFSEEAAAKAYRQYAWLRDQVRAFVFDRARFSKASLES